MSFCYSNYSPLFNPSTAGLKFQPALETLHVISPLLQILLIHGRFSTRNYDNLKTGYVQSA